MAWRFSQDRPVFIQIGEQIKKAVVSGEYPPGAKIPTVRQIALDAAVNPNTVQHAFSVLETEGIIISKGTLGKFVTEDKEILKACRNKMAMRLTEEFLFNIKELGFSPDEALTLIYTTNNSNNTTKEDTADE
ncbi:MAG: GntR family transcriptional regulator [Ruminococcaceae bacterium]|nr:GntR family transcriptional regulator [Oscillospiraceae bacterium]